jgi:hypothetical protein
MARQDRSRNLYKNPFLACNKLSIVDVVVKKALAAMLILALSLPPVVNFEKANPELLYFKPKYCNISVVSADRIV